MLVSSDIAEILIFFIISCSLSVFMSFLIVILYFKYASIKKNMAAQLIITMSILDIFTWFFRIIAAVYKLSTNETYEETNHSLCVFFGFLWSFFNLITFFIVFTIGFGVYYGYKYKSDLEKHKKTLYFIIFILALVLSCIPFFSSSYGEIDHVKCWIDDYNLRIFTFYLPLWLVFLFNCYFIGYVILKLRLMPIDTSVQRKLILKFSLFPLLMFLAWFPSSIRRSSNSDNFALELFMYIMMPLQGVFNPIAYGLINEDVEKKMKEFFFCQCEKEKNDNVENSSNTDISIAERNSNNHLNYLFLAH